MIEPFKTANDADAFAHRYCASKGLRYLSHEYYYHSNGKGTGNQLWIAVEDFSGRYEVKLNLNEEMEPVL